MCGLSHSGGTNAPWPGWVSSTRPPALTRRMTAPSAPPAPPSHDGVPFGCVLGAWRAHEGELHAYLVHRVGDASLADDLLQDVFVKAMRQGQGFCTLQQPRAWLFQVARNALVDHARAQRPTEPADEDLPVTEVTESAAVDLLADQLARVLRQLEAADEDVLRACDLNGERQQAYADRRGLTLPAVKARLLRARQRLRARLIVACAVRFDERGSVCCVDTDPADPTRLR